MEGAVNDLLLPTAGALKELPDELLLPREGEVKDLLTPPEGELKDLLPLFEGALEGPSKDLC